MGRGRVCLQGVSLSVVTYNMHGFNQGCTLLQELCESNLYDVIFVQEHWLSPAVINKILNFNDKYIGYGISAMSDAVSCGVLRGRPYGGVSILLKEKYAKVCKGVYSFDRLVAISLCDLLLINTYMPCEDGSISSLNC